MSDGYLAFGIFMETTVMYFVCFSAICAIVSAVFMILTQLELFKITRTSTPQTENTRLDAERERFFEFLHYTVEKLQIVMVTRVDFLPPLDFMIHSCCTVLCR